MQSLLLSMEADGKSLLTGLIRPGVLSQDNPGVMDTSLLMVYHLSPLLPALDSLRNSTLIILLLPSSMSSSRLDQLVSLSTTVLSLPSERITMKEWSLPLSVSEILTFCNHGSLSFSSSLKVTTDMVKKASSTMECLLLISTINKPPRSPTSRLTRPLSPSQSQQHQYLPLLLVNALREPSLSSMSASPHSNDLFIEDLYFANHY